MKRYVFMVSDGTGITAENFGNSLMTQFDNIELEKQIIPYVDTLEKAERVVEKINECYLATAMKPVVFITMTNPKIVHIIKQSHSKVFDLFSTYLPRLEKALSMKSVRTIGQTHGVTNLKTYSLRIEAIEFTMTHDDGVKVDGYQQADIILLGVSRSGKTPSCLYMALHYGVLAANYPITEEDLLSSDLPKCLQPYKHKLFGLTIDLERLQQIRQARRPNSPYASLEQCRIEVNKVERLYRQENIPYLNSTHFSIEEISTKILSIAGLKRKI